MKCVSPRLDLWSPQPVFTYEQRKEIEIVDEWKMIFRASSHKLSTVRLFVFCRHFSRVVYYMCFLATTHYWNGFVVLSYTFFWRCSPMTIRRIVVVGVCVCVEQDVNIWLQRGIACVSSTRCKHPIILAAFYFSYKRLLFRIYEVIHVMDESDYNARKEAKKRVCRHRHPAPLMFAASSTKKKDRVVQAELECSCRRGKEKNCGISPLKSRSTWLVVHLLLVPFSPRASSRELDCRVRPTDWREEARNMKIFRQDSQHIIIIKMSLNVALLISDPSFSAIPIQQSTHPS